MLVSGKEPKIDGVDRVRYPHRRPLRSAWMAAYGRYGESYTSASTTRAQHPVALKTFKPQYLSNGDARERFLKEADTWVRLGTNPTSFAVTRCFRIPATGCVLGAGTGGERGRA